MHAVGMAGTFEKKTRKQAQSSAVSLKVMRLQVVNIFSSGVRL